MDKTALLSVDLERGSEVLDILDRAGLKVSVATWAHLSEYGDWRLILAGRQLDALGTRDAYGAIHEALAAAGLGAYQTPNILILSMSDKTVRDLRRAFGKAKSVEGMRLGGQLFGDRFFEDGYAYRIS